MAILTTRALGKRYGTKVGVEDVSLEVQPGAIFFVFLSVIEYYRPANILKTGSLPVGDIVVLLAIGGIAWIAGCEITARRNICTT